MSLCRVSFLSLLCFILDWSFNYINFENYSSQETVPSMPSSNSSEILWNILCWTFQYSYLKPIQCYLHSRVAFSSSQSGSLTAVRMYSIHSSKVPSIWHPLRVLQSFCYNLCLPCQIYFPHHCDLIISKMSSPLSKGYFEHNQAWYIYSYFYICCILTFQFISPSYIFTLSCRIQLPRRRNVFLYLT